MNCPGSEQLAGFADRTMEASERDAFEAHLVVCEKCRAEVLSIVEAIEDEGTAPAGMADRVLKRLPRESISMKTRFLGVAAALALAAVGFWIGTRSIPPEKVVVIQEVRVQTPPNPQFQVQTPQPAIGVDSPRGTEIGLGGGFRMLGTLSTDKQVYRPGERVYARCVLLDYRRGFGGFLDLHLELSTFGLKNVIGILMSHLGGGLCGTRLNCADEVWIRRPQPVR